VKTPPGGIAGERRKPQTRCDSGTDS